MPPTSNQLLFAEHDGLDGLAGPDALGLGADEGQGVGSGQRAHEARALRADGAGEPAVLRFFQAHPHGVHPAELVDDVFLEVDGYAGPLEVLAAHHGHEGGADEEVEADHRGDGVAGEAEEARLVAFAVEEGFSRLELYAPEDLLDPEVEQRALDEVLLPYRDPAARHDHVRRFERLLYSGAQRRGGGGGGGGGGGRGA